MLFDQGKLEKLKIQALLPAKNSDEPPQPSDASEDTYVVQVNPSNSALSRLLEYTRHQGQGSSSSEAVYNRSSPVTLQFEFLFDGTGVIPPPSELGDVPLIGAIASALSESEPFTVWGEIEKFETVVYTPDSKVHRPRPLLLRWGTLVFPCVLITVSYRFTLFKADGTPLRAVAACSFCESISDAERTRRENFSSPDLTHLRDVQDGDTLPLLAYRIYGNTQLYLEVARVNKLVNFRRLRSASRIAFPPLAKEPKR